MGFAARGAGPDEIERTRIDLTPVDRAKARCTAPRRREARLAEREKGMRIVEQLPRRRLRVAIARAQEQALFCERCGAAAGREALVEYAAKGDCAIGRAAAVIRIVDLDPLLAAGLRQDREGEGLLRLRGATKSQRCGRRIGLRGRVGAAPTRVTARADEARKGDQRKEHEAVPAAPAAGRPGVCGRAKSEMHRPRNISNRGA